MPQGPFDADGREVVGGEKGEDLACGTGFGVWVQFQDSIRFEQSATDISKLQSLELRNQV